MLSNMVHNENLIVGLVMLSKTLVRLFVFCRKEIGNSLLFFTPNPPPLPPSLFIYCFYIHFDRSIFLCVDKTVTYLCHSIMVTEIKGLVNIVIWVLGNVLPLR